MTGYEGMPTQIWLVFSTSYNGEKSFKRKGVNVKYVLTISLQIEVPKSFAKAKPTEYEMAFEFSDSLKIKFSARFY